MRTRKAFTLIELVVVVMIIGILVAIAAPKMLNITADANDNSVRMSLEVIRDAVETHAAQNLGVYPAGDEATIKTTLETYIRGPFPKSLVGTKGATIKVDTADPLSADASGDWMYNVTTGEFIINCTAVSGDGTTKFSEF
jgi:general secretion pathway protein G